MLNKTTESVNSTDKKEESKPAKLGDKEIIRLEQRQPQHKVVIEREKQKLEEAEKKLEEAEKRLEEAKKLKAEKLEADELEAELFKIREYKAEKLGVEESEADEFKIKQYKGGKFEIEDLQPIKRHNFTIARESCSSAMPSVEVSFADSDEDMKPIAHKRIFDTRLFKDPSFLIKKPETLKEQPEALEEDLEIDREVSDNKSPKNNK